MFNFENKCKPILKWAGGKTSLLPQLINYFPHKFNRYIEPFLGGGALFLSFTQTKPAIINDYNEEIVNLYLTIKDFPLELVHTLDLYEKKYSEEFYYALRSEQLKNNKERAARTIFLNKTGFNGLYRQNSKGEFNVPFGKRPKCPALYDLENMLEVSKRLQAATLCNYDFEHIIDMATEGDFVYCDPPYEPLSTTSSFNSYNKNKFSKSEQIRLRDSCIRAAKRGAHIAISNSMTPFIIEIYQGFEIIKIQARRSINSDGLKRGCIEEALVLMP